MNVFNFFATLGWDDSKYREGLNSAESAGYKFGQKLGNGLKTVAKIGGAALGATAGGILKLTKDSIAAYGEYEQLVGGTELMFGSASDFIMERSKTAYKEVQMSARDYLTEVNKYAVGLKTALGGDEEAAAKLADDIITAQADIVAATGNSAEAVQNAFNGIMRGNYTMLDNLGLGIAGTQEGMKKVIDAVNEANGTKYDITNVADAQKALIDYVKMQGMAGYASSEGATTIQGSIASMKGAWDNFITSLADPEQDVAETANNLVESVVGVVRTIVPAIQRVLPAIVDGFGTLVKSVADQLPTLMTTILPSLLDAALSLLNGFVDALPSVLDVVIDVIPQLLDTVLNEALPKVVEAAAQVIVSLATGIAEYLPKLIPTLINAIFTIADILVSNLDAIIEAGLQLILALVEGVFIALPMLLDKMPVLFTKLLESLMSNLPMILEMGTELVMMLLAGIIAAIPNLIAYFPTGFSLILETLMNMDWETMGGDIINALLEGLKKGWDYIVEWVGSAGENFVNSFSNFFTLINDLTGGFFTDLLAGVQEFLSKPFYYVGVALGELVRAWIDFQQLIGSKIVDFFTTTVPNYWDRFWNWIKTLPGNLVALFRTLASNLVETVKKLPDKFKEIGKNIVDGLWNGFKNAWSTFKENVSDLAEGFIDGFKGIFKIASPSRVFRRLGEYVVEGFEEGVEGLADMTQLERDINASIGNLNANINPIDMSTTGGAFAISDKVSSDILNLLSEYLPTLSNMRVVMDTGATVGALAPTMDRELGRMALMQARGGAY